MLKKTCIRIFPVFNDSLEYSHGSTEFSNALKPGENESWKYSGKAIDKVGSKKDFIGLDPIVMAILPLLGGINSKTDFEALMIKRTATKNGTLWEVS